MLTTKLVFILPCFLDLFIFLRHPLHISVDSIEVFSQYLVVVLSDLVVENLLVEFVDLLSLVPDGSIEICYFFFDFVVVVVGC